jgi:hypothetical protein
MIIEKSTSPGWFTASQQTKLGLIVGSGQTREQALDRCFEKLEWLFPKEKVLLEVEPRTCSEGICDGSGWITEGEFDDLRVVRCLCNPKVSMEELMDDDSDKGE